MARSKKSRERVPLDVSAPIPLDLLGGLDDDDTIEEREDGIKGVGQLGSVRDQGRSPRPLPLSAIQQIEAAAVWGPDWERAVEIDRRMRHDGPGQQMKTNAMTMFVFQQAHLEFQSRAARAERELRDPLTWERICRTVAEAYPDMPERRLHPKPPTYKQYWRFRKEYVGDIDEIRSFKRLEAIEVAEYIELLDPDKGSLSHPSRANTIVGDAKVLNGAFNATAIDPKTGEPTGRRHDPDMHRYHKGDRQTGRRMVSLTCRADYFQERVMADVTTMHVTEGSESSVVLGMVEDLVPHAHVAALAYDMALSASVKDALMELGVQPLSKVSRTGKHRYARAFFGEHKFKLADGTKPKIGVHALDGWLGIKIPTVEGEKFSALEPVQIKNATNKDGTYRWWQIWRVRDHPEIPMHLRGATVHFRHSRSDEDPKSRSLAASLHPEGSETFKSLYPKRSDIESMHRHLQDHMFNERVSTVGDRNLRIWLHSYQTHVNRTALSAWHYRTGGDISRWFGKWRPPPLRQPAAA